MATLSRIEGLNINSMEKVSGDRPYGGINLDAILANKSTSKFWDLRTDLMLNALNELAISFTIF